MEQIEDSKLEKEQESEAKQKKVDEQKAKGEEIRKAASTTLKRKSEGLLFINIINRM